MALKNNLLGYFATRGTIYKSARRNITEDLTFNFLIHMSSTYAFQVIGHSFGVVSIERQWLAAGALVLRFSFLEWCLVAP